MHHTIRQDLQGMPQEAELRGLLLFRLDVPTVEASLVMHHNSDGRCLSAVHFATSWQTTLCSTARHATMQPIQLAMLIALGTAESEVEQS